MVRYCPCGARIAWNRSLCRDCIREYGYDKERWPAWLRFYVADMQREIDYERNHDDLAIEPDERYPSEMGDGALEAAWAEIGAWIDTDGAQYYEPQEDPETATMRYMRYAPYDDEFLNRQYRRANHIQEHDSE